MVQQAATHLDILLPGLIQNGSYVFTHEVNSQDCYSGAALFHHFDSPISHDQAVTDVDMGPSLCSSGQHPLHFWVHVEVGNNADLLGRQHLCSSIHVRGGNMHTHFAKKPERALLQEDRSLQHAEEITSVYGLCTWQDGHLDECFNLSCVRGQVLGLGLCKAALWGDSIASDVQGWEPGELLC